MAECTCANPQAVANAINQASSKVSKSIDGAGDKIDKTLHGAGHGGSSGVLDTLRFCTGPHPNMVRWVRMPGRTSSRQRR